MKIKNYLLKLTVGIAAFVFGFAWFSAFQYFQTVAIKANQEVSIKKHEMENTQTQSYAFTEDAGQDFVFSDDADSTKEIEIVRLKKSEGFNPEGRYYFFEEHKGFEDIFFVSIQNKDLDVDQDDEKFKNSVSLEGVFVLEDTDNGAEDGCELHDYIYVPIIKIEDGKISFISKKKKGVTYEFKGEFLIKENYRTINVDEKVLKGTLKKKKNGKIIAKKELTFGRDTSEKCFH